MSPAEDFVLWSNLPDERIEVRDSDVVFAGYGVVAPEYKWNDYAGIDVKGKTVIVITGDPPVADPGDSTKLDERVFLGNALTVYGRTGTKLATAFNHGAAAVLLVPPAQPFRYVWENNARENMTLRDGNERQQLKAQALVSIDKAATIFAATGNDFERARAAAAAPGFRAVALSARVTITVTNQVRRFESQNILAKIEGSDPALKNEYVIYSGHWDHHGREGNRIFHGASDNAAGTAGVLELARAFRSLNPRPKRTIVFLWPTAEEKGLLGSHYYVDPSALSSRLYRREYQSRLFQQLGMGTHQRISALSASAIPRWTISPPKPFNARAAPLREIRRPSSASTSAPTITNSPASASHHSKPLQASTMLGNPLALEKRSARLYRERLPRCIGRDQTRLGSTRRRGRPPDSARSRLPRRPTTRPPHMEAGRGLAPAAFTVTFAATSQAVVFALIRASIESLHRIAFLRAGSSRGTRAAMLKRCKWSDKI